MGYLFLVFIRFVSGVFSQLLGPCVISLLLIVFHCLVDVWCFLVVIVE